ncbi:MAG: haloacid dehalogenase [Planctomycetaceae bacterium]|nr:haloacid dehalogenase [Planctomycetaceae bacterium]
MPQFAVLFDVDGVLTDSYRPHFLSWQRLMGELGVEFTEENFRATFGRTNPDIFQQLYPGELSAEQMSQWGERKEVLYREIITEEFYPMPGAVELVDALAGAGFLLGVGSSGPPENVHLTLEKLDRADRFGAVITGADVSKGKPEPEVFLKGAAGLGLPPAACAVIEDAPQGIEAANRAGMTSIAITGTAPRESFAHAKLVIDSHAELSPERIAQLIAANDQ